MKISKTAHQQQIDDTLGATFTCTDSLLPFEYEWKLATGKDNSSSLTQLITRIMIIIIIIIIIITTTTTTIIIIIIIWENSD